MYAVDFKMFHDFLIKNRLYDKEPIITERTPFILEFKRDGVMMAKVEMVSIEEYKFLKKHPNVKGQTKNIYWIRGNEWKTIDGILVQKLEI